MTRTEARRLIRAHYAEFIRQSDFPSDPRLQHPAVEKAFRDEIQRIADRIEK
jgi:hypothetical protein